MTDTVDVEFINFLGDKVDTTKRVKLVKRESATSPDKFHKGWRVVGVSPDAVEAACKSRQEGIDKAVAHNERWKAGQSGGGMHDVPTPLDVDAWIKSAPLRPARSKPFEIEDAARECRDLAVKAGWHRVEIRRLAKGVT